MSNVVNVKNIRKTVETKYAPLEVDLGGETIELKQVLRLDDFTRKKVSRKMDEIQKVYEDDDADPIDLIEVGKEVILLLAGDKAEALEEATGGDVLVYGELFEAWMDVTQPGEAESSPN